MELDCLSIKKEANNIRKDAYRIARIAGGGHLAGACSSAELLATLYFGDVLRYDANKPQWNERDLFILSKGHVCFALYAVLLHAGFFSAEVLNGICQPGSEFGGHPKIGIPGVEASTGSLGHGLSFGIGNALVMKRKNCDRHVYVLMGDGECDEGSVWEAALSAPTLNLDNLTLIIDANGLQGMGKTDSIVSLEPFTEKWRTFGWNAIEIDGHDPQAIQEALLQRVVNTPTAVIARTIKGKGASFMENRAIWHFRMPDADETKILLDELDISEDAVDTIGG